MGGVVPTVGLRGQKERGAMSVLVGEVAAQEGQTPGGEGGMGQNIQGSCA